MRRRGRPILGAFAGFFFGLFLALDLLMLKVLPSDSIVLLVLPILFLVIGIVLGLAAPLRRGAGPPAAAAEPGPEPA
jgi:hypothetical protein